MAVSQSIVVGRMRAWYRCKEEIERKLVLKFEVNRSIVEKVLGSGKKWGKTEKLELFWGWGEVEKEGGVGEKK